MCGRQSVTGGGVCWCQVVPLRQIPVWRSSAQFKVVKEVLPEPVVTAEEYVQLELSDFELSEPERRKPIAC